MNSVLWSIFTWILMIAALVGVILNIKKKGDKDDQKTVPRS